MARFSALNSIGMGMLGQEISYDLGGALPAICSFIERM